MSAPETKERYRFLRFVVKELHGHPEYLLVFGFCVLLFGIGGALFGVALFKSSVVLAVAGVSTTAIASVVIIVTIAMVRRSPAEDTGEVDTEPTKTEESLTQLNTQLLKEVDLLRGELTSFPMVKTGLHFRLILSPAKKQRCVLSKMIGRFEVKNASDHIRVFNFAAQIEVSRDETETVSADLSVTDKKGTQRDKFRFDLKAEPDSPIIRLFQKTYEIPGGQEWIFEWETTSYHLDLPYAEFWASAHPVHGMKVEVDVREVPDLRATADCYRGEGTKTFRRDCRASRFEFTAAGPFLPYNGIFIKVQRDEQERGGANSVRVAERES